MRRARLWLRTKRDVVDAFIAEVDANTVLRKERDTARGEVRDLTKAIAREVARRMRAEETARRYDADRAEWLMVRYPPESADAEAARHDPVERTGGR